MSLDRTQNSLYSISSLSEFSILCAYHYMIDLRYAELLRLEERLRYLEGKIADIRRRLAAAHCPAPSLFSAVPRRTAAMNHRSSYSRRRRRH